MRNWDGRERKKLRKDGYDYSLPGYYFVTMCVQRRLPVFGSVVGRRMQLNEPGKMVWDVWNDIPNFYQSVAIDEFVVMPDHAHGLLRLKAGGIPENRLSLPEIMHRFKSLTTNLYAKGVKERGWPSFPGRLWQLSYYDRIVWNIASLDAIRIYIRNNPGRYVPKLGSPPVAIPT